MLIREASRKRDRQTDRQTGITYPKHVFFHWVVNPNLRNVFYGLNFTKDTFHKF
jgi:hypothetical protein